MPTILKRDSENLAPVNAPELKHSKSEVRSAYDRTADLIAAWGAGRFKTDSEGLDAAIAEFFTEGVELDRSAAAHSGLDGYKVYHGHEGVKEWYAFLDAFDYEGDLQMSFVAGPAPNEVWLRVSVERLINKKTGKATPFELVEVYTWEGSRCTKSVLSVFQPASVAAICSEEEHLPIPPFAQLPAFEPHPNPMEPWAEKMALWTAGDFYSEEGLLEEHTAENAVCIVSDSAMPEVFRTYEGIAGVKEWNDHQSSLWELSNVALAPVAGLKPGCVLHKVTCDVKHKVTGKEAAGVQLFAECAYDVDGKFVYARHFFVNAPLLASIYAKSAVERTADLLAAWGAGRFNTGDGDVVLHLAEFFTEDAVVDASSAAHSGVEAYKVHSGFAGLKEWFGYVGLFEYEGMEMAQVAGPAPGEVWLRFSSKQATCKATGKSVESHGFNVFTWEGGRVTKLTVAVYNPASVAAIMNEEEGPIPQPLPLPAFEPHPSPLEPFGEMMALWGAGEMSKAEVRAQHCAADCVDDLTDTALAAGPPGDVFKPHVGLDGLGAWMAHSDGQWDMSGVDAAPVAIAPGRVMMRLTCDIKHTVTGKEAKGVQMYNELAYDADGKFVYNRHFFVNAPLLASIY